MAATQNPTSHSSGKRPPFDYALAYDRINFREHPESYRVGRGEQGVLLVEPYKSELLPLWRFRTPEIAQQSAEALFARFQEYVASDDFVGMDMARKFLQMGFTRARRYANHRDGRKYEPTTGRLKPLSPDPVKAESARIFYDFYVRARENPKYARLRREHQNTFG